MAVTARFGLLILSATLLAAGCSKHVEQAAQKKPASYRVYVSNETSNDISVIDGATNRVIATVPVGKRPRGIRPSADGHTLFIALSGFPIAGPGVDEDKLPPPDKSADGIAVFDVAENKVVNVLHGVVNPEQIAVSPDGKLYLASEETQAMEVVDSKTGAAAGHVPVGGEPEGVAVSPDGKFAYVTSEDDNKILIVDTANNAVVASLPVGGRPRSIAFSPDGTRAYVTAELGKSVTVIDAAHHSILATVHLTGDPLLPMGVVVSPDGKRLYVTTGRGGTLAVIDTVSMGVLATIPVGKRPWGVAVSPDGRFVYTANGTSDDVSVVDTASLKVVAKIKSGGRPWGVTAVAE